jgi:hypothetical protein
MKEQIIKAIINSLGFLEDTEGHGYKLHIYKDEWWISHNIVGSGEPVKDWLEREFNKLDNETWREELQTCLNCKNAGICDDDFECKWEPIKTE